MFTLEEYGASIDVGTSHIAINLVSLNDCKAIDYSVESNPQSVVGADVVTRLKYHASRSTSVVDLCKLVRNHIDGQLYEMFDSLSLPLDGIDKIVIVGNSAMHHILFDKDITPLLNEPFVGIDTHEISCNGQEIDIITLKRTRVYSPPLVGGFIGNDAIAVAVESGVTKKQEKALLVDIGVNTEVGLYDSETLHFASAASGPAFEEMSIEYGMSAKEGAISGFELGNESTSSNTETISDTPAQGICGSGSISILAALVENGLVDRSGTFVSPKESSHIEQRGDSRIFKVIRGRDDWIVLTQRDIRMIQQSKAAIRAAIEVLLQETGILPEDIEDFYITGEFGASLNPQEAFKISMFPQLPNAEIRQQANGAIKGANKILCSASGEELCHSISEQVRYVNLTSNPLFDKQYAIHRLFQC